MRFLRVWGSFSFLLALGAIHANEPWFWVSPAAQVYDITELATLNDNYYAVTRQGHVATSADGKAWSIVFAGDPLHRLLRIKNLRGQLYAVGDRGRILRSLDGLIWNEVFAASHLSLRAIADTGNELVALAASGEILRSASGVTWYVYPTNLPGASARFSDLAFGNGVYLATAELGLDAEIYRSLDGSTWTSSKLPTVKVSGWVDSIGRVLFAEGKFVAVGGRHNVLVSTDGLTWSANTAHTGNTGSSPKSVYHLNNRWVVPGYQGVLLSPDAVTWTHHQAPELNAAAFAKGTYLAAGSPGSVYTSTTGTEWERPTPPVATTRFTNITYGLGKFYAVGVHGRTHTSTDGLTWEMAPSALSTITSAYGDSDIVILAGFGFVKVLRRDTTNENAIPSRPDEVWRNVIKWKQRYYVFGIHSVYTSEDAVTWTQLALPGGGFSDGAASDSAMIVAVGSKMFHSTDGVTFSPVPGVDPVYPVDRLAYFKGEFIATVGQRWISRSRDGFAWSPLTPLAWSRRGNIESALNDNPAGATLAESTVLSGNMSVVEGQLYVSIGHAALATTDARTWGLADLPSAIAASDGQRVVAVYADGGIAVRRVASSGELTNISARSILPVEGSPLILGTVLLHGKKTILVRASGASLRELGITGTTAANPWLALFQGSTAGETNDDWDSAPQADMLADIMSRAGAYPWKRGSKEAAVAAQFPAGAMTVHIKDTDGPAGVGLAELYAVPAQAGDTGTIVNLSTRGTVKTGEGVLIAGFVIAGGNGTVLVRGIGPGLLPLGVADALPATRLDVYAGTRLLAANDAWSSGGSGAEVRHYSARLGAFALNEGSRDSALVLTLPPGGYTAVLSTPSGQTGSGLIEVYLFKP